MNEQERGGQRDLGKYEATYLTSGFEAVQARYRKTMLIELLKRLQPRRVLEVGCGADTLATHWSGAETFVIVEPSEGFAAGARAQTADQAGVRVVEATLEEAAPQLRGEAFDLVLLSGLLHEVSDARGLLATTRGLCGSQTFVHVNVPNARSLHRLLALEMGLIRDLTEASALQKALQQPRIFTAESLEQCVAQAGFEVVEQGSYFIKPFTHAQMQSLIESGFLTQPLLDGLFGLGRHLPGLGSEIYLNARARDPA